jgi:hypothetical protein
MNESCSKLNLSITNQSFQFSSNYKLRFYQSACFYLDSNNNWQSDGLLVIMFTSYHFFIN